jgi:arylsulfatase A-like enzyme
MDKLDELDLADNTAVIFFSDNGGLLVKEGVRITSNAPLRGGKGMLYEGGIREPMIIRLPGVVAPGGTCDEPVTSVDFHPTILEMAGVKAKSPNPIDGVSLFPLLKGTGRLNRGAIYWHYPHYHLGKPSGAIRQSDWKLIEFYEDGRLELYNLKDDLSEKNNLATKNPEKATELTKELDGWRKRVKARTPTPNPDYDPARADQPPPRPAKPTKPKT